MDWQESSFQGLRSMAAAFVVTLLLGMPLVLLSEGAADGFAPALPLGQPDGAGGRTDQALVVPPDLAMLPPFHLETP